MRRTDLIQLGKRALLDVGIFGGGLDDQVADREVFEASRALQPRERRVALGGGQLAALDGGADRLFDALAAARQQIVAHFADQGRIARAGTHLGNARAHQPAADHANSSDVHRGSV